MIRKKALYLFLVGIIFLYVYNPPIYFLPMNAGIIVGMGFLACYALKFISNLLVNKNIYIDRSFLNIAIAIGVIVCYSLSVAVVSRSFDFQVFKSYLSFLLFYIPGAFGIVWIAKRYFKPIDVMKMFIWATVVQSVIIMMMLIVPSVKDFFFSLLRDGSARVEKNLFSGGFRFLGFAFNSTWDLSIVQSMAIMYICLLFKLDKKEINLKNTLFFLLLAMSIFLTGRTGFIGLLLGLIILIVPSSFKEVPLLKATKFFGKLMAITLPLFFLIIITLPSDVKDVVEKNVMPWAFELFQNETGGKVETASSNELQAMYFVPEPSTFLIGDGYYVNPYDTTRYYMDTDAGYMRHILFYGIVGCLLMTTIYGMIFLKIYKSSTVLGKSNSLKLFSILVAFYFFLSHVKGDLFLGADMPIKSLFLLMALLTGIEKIDMKHISKTSLE